ncbi:MAG: DNA polymerase III subunit beta [Candidatus Jorgensenbacteria bacterium]
MKLIILRNNFAAALYAAERAVGINTNLAILKNVLLKTEDSRILVTATNLELAITATVPGKIIEPGEVTVPFAILNTIVRNVTTERVTLEEHDRNLLITTDNYEAKVQTQGAKDFPIIPSVQSTANSLSLPAELLRDALGNVVVATQFSDIRPEISGVFVRYSEGKLTFVATDSFRLAEQVLEGKQVVSGFDEVSAIIPLRTAEELLRVLDPENGNVKVFIDANQALFQTASLSIISRLIDGVFPEYRTIIPKQVQHEFSVNRQELQNAIKLVSAFSGRTNDISLMVGEGKKFLELHSADSAFGENRYRVPIKLKGDKFSIVFNWRYLLDGLKSYRGEEILLGVNAADRPAVLRSATEPALTYVLMPIKS